MGNIENVIDIGFVGIKFSVIKINDIGNKLQFVTIGKDKFSVFQ